MCKYRIRAHHGLCISLFEGKGYSDEFIQNMFDIIEQLKDNPQIEIINSIDIVCSKCNRNENGSCKDSHLTDALDGEVLKACKIEAGDKMRWKEYTEIIKQSIVLQGKQEYICKGCQWIELCKKSQSEILI
ncbi:MAG: DUF1284 domain-containing protein [Oscillospiraceae bacterium]